MVRMWRQSQIYEKVISVLIQQANHALKILKNFGETTRVMEDEAFSAIMNLDDIVKYRNSKKQTLIID